MKRKILSLVFAAAMLLGTATKTSANDWDCEHIYLSCGPLEAGHMVLICGDNNDEFYDQWFEWQNILCETLDEDGRH